jgi:uncharacterized protein YkwD
MSALALVNTDGPATKDVFQKRTKMNTTGKMVVVLAALLATFLYLPQASGQRKSSSRGTVQLKEVEKVIFRLTNEVRRKNGLTTLDRDEDLNVMARAYSVDMLKRKFFSHENPDGLSLKDRLIPHYSAPIARAGENIWGGSGLDLSDSKLLGSLIVESWMASPGHRANILRADYTHIGIGVIASGNEVRATQQFIRR